MVKRRLRGGGGQKLPILRRHGLWTDPYWKISCFADVRCVSIRNRLIQQIPKIIIPLSSNRGNINNFLKKHFKEFHFFLVNFLKIHILVHSTYPLLFFVFILWQIKYVVLADLHCKNHLHNLKILTKEKCQKSILKHLIGFHV